VRHGEAIRLAPKALDLLIALVRDAGRLVTKDQLLARVWPDSFVEEGILTVQISALRKARGGEASYIETVPRTGYRFVAPVTIVPSAADLMLRGAARPIEVYELVGRGRAHHALGFIRSSSRLPPPISFRFPSASDEAFRPRVGAPRYDI